MTCILPKIRLPVWVKRLLIVFLLLIAFLDLLGTFDFTAPGIKIFSMFTHIMGDYAYLSSFICLGFAFVFWLIFNQRPDASPKKSVKTQTDRDANQKLLDHKKSAVKNPRVLENPVETLSSPSIFSVPPGKLVTLHGFRDYFETSEWAEVAKPKVDLKELGADFPSYFYEGNETNRSPRESNYVSVKGFRNYFEQVRHEIDSDNEAAAGLVMDAVLRDRNIPLDSLAQPATQRSPESPPNAQPAAETLLPPEPEPRIAERITRITPPENEPFITKKPAAPVESGDFVREEVASVESEPFAPEPDDDADGEAAEIASAVKSLPAATPPDRTDRTERGEPASSFGRRSTARTSYALPEITIFRAPQAIPAISGEEDTTALKVEEILQEFGVKAKVVRHTQGPVITRYELVPAPGVKISKIVNLSDDIALALAAGDIRIEAPIPGKSAIGIEVPNKNMRTVGFREIFETETCRRLPSKLKIALGKDIANQSIVADLRKMPHLLIAGSTGAGKSVCITSIIISILMNALPSDVKLLLIDPKMVELNHYQGIPHLLFPVINDPQKAAASLKWMVKEMETRYELFAAAGVRDIERYNQAKGADSNAKLPWIVVVIDELADLMQVAASEVEDSICRLAQMARAAGIHLVIATQRPSVDVITGTIKANIPSRISFAVASQIDSRTILDTVGAEKLYGKGDMLYAPLGTNKAIRVQGCLILDEEVTRVIQHWKQQGKPEYLDPSVFFESGGTGEKSDFTDDLFCEAGELLISSGIASITFIQRRLRVGYARAARLMDLLEESGVVGGYEGAKQRQILMTLEEFQERF